MQRYGMTVPFDGPLHTQRDRFTELVDLGYTDVWSAEADGHDGFTPLALASVWAPELRLGTAIIPAFTRGPACLAQSVGSLAQAAPGRFAIGIGTSSDVIVERWNGIPFEEPYKKIRDMIRFLRASLDGEKIVEDYDTFSIKGFRLKAKPPEPVPIVVAALREGMLKLAGREGDGAIINWLSAEDVKTVAPIVHGAARAASEEAPAPTPAGSEARERPQPRSEEREIVARIFCAPVDDPDLVYPAAKFAIAAYLNVPVYAAFHEWMGRGEQLTPMWTKWKEGDRQGALDAIPNSLVDELIVHGPPEKCREHIQEYIANGVTTPALAPLPFGYDMEQAVRDLAPR
ncbi:MAG: LLM class F420-dependent oxidoreductase [Acidimicrobiales bacterium]|nr:LLM class F420-dependent oxidoreductase [Acidimicrobiales bacterium]